MNRREIPNIDRMMFNKKTLHEFKNIYYKTINNKEDRFVFKNRTFLVDYAKYVIEYLEEKL